MQQALQPSACLFDLDDLLIRSKPTWRAAVIELLSKHDIPAERANDLNYRGLSAQDTARLIYDRLEPVTPLDQFIEQFNEILLDEVSNRGADPLPGARQMVRWARGQGKVAVASGSPLPVIHRLLASLGFHSFVDVVVSSHHVARGKPWPDVFLEAARQLDVEPKACLVFEDSLVGVGAAAAAQMPCISVPSEKQELIAQMTPHVFETLHHAYVALSSGLLGQDALYVARHVLPESESSESHSSSNVH